MIDLASVASIGPRKGAAVTLFVDLEGVRLADPRQPISLRWGTQDRTIGTVAYQVKVRGLRGGHSGMDIDKGRGHATKLLVRLLRLEALGDHVGVAGLAGGTAANAIPREASALIVVPEGQVDAFLECGTIRAKYPGMNAI